MVEAPTAGGNNKFKQWFGGGAEEYVVEKIREHQEKLLPFTGPYIGKRNLDIGCGTGIPSLVHQEKLGIEPTLCDTRDIRDESATSFPFLRIEGNKLPFQDNSFDSSYIQYVLHHMPRQSDVVDVLLEAFRVSPRLVLVEEIRGERTDVSRAKKIDEAMNSIVHPNIPMPVREYFSVQELEALLNALGRKPIFHALVSGGTKENGFLEQHVFVAE